MSTRKPTLADVLALSRREALKLGVLGAGASVLGGALLGCASGSKFSSADTSTAAERRRILRIAHLTDWHIQPERRAFDGVAACFRHVQSLKDPPQLIVSGGDLIMDGYDATRDRTKTQWELWSKVLRDECSVPILHTLGNHDIWGWNKDKSGTSGSEAGWGKRWACDMVGRDTPWHAADFAGVRVVILDSTQPADSAGYGYIAYCDEAQWDWLQRLFASTPKDMPVVVVSHIPIVSATGLTDDRAKGVREEDTKVGRGILHADASRLHALFKSHGNVRAALSGHMHLVDRVEWGGITYLCNGAVSGGWWSGPNQDCHAGYALVDLFSDGSVERRYVTYGWQYQS